MISFLRGILLCISMESGHPRDDTRLSYRHLLFSLEYFLQQTEVPFLTALTE